MNRLKLPKKVYFKKGSMNVALKELDEVYDFKRALIISDAKLYREGVVAPVDRLVSQRGIRTAEFFTLDAVPSFENVRSGLPKMLEFQPEVIIGVGGGSVMSAAKIMWLLYENPDIDLNEIADKFNGTDASYVDFPDTGKKATLVLISTTSGSGAECSPFAVLADDKGNKRVIASYKLVPEIAVIDSMFSDNMPADLTKNSGLTVLTQAVRAYIAPNATDYSKGFAISAVKRVLDNLETVVANGAKAPAEREHMANAAVLAGMAVSNSAYTIDVNATWYPTEAEKDAKGIGADAFAGIIDLAKHVGFSGNDNKIFSDWIAACEKLNNL